MHSLRKFHLIFFCFLSFCCFSEKAFTYPVGTEFRFAPFFASDSKIRDSLNTPLPFLEIENSYHFTPCWDIWTGVGYVYGSGRTCKTGVKRSLYMVPITLGVRRFFCLMPKLESFVGAGGVWSMYHENIKCHFSGKQRIKKNGFGAVLRGGFQYEMAENFIIAFTAEYLFQTFRFHRVNTPCRKSSNTDMSGTKFGFGVLYDY
jgi:hypothetical protein